MWKSEDKVYIWPADGLEAGEAERREIPLQGYFAVKFGKGQLEAALAVITIRNRFDRPHWQVFLNGFMITPPTIHWKEAFGDLWKRAEKSGAPILIGRKLTLEEYSRLVQSRASDKERGIDLSNAVDLNHVEIPAFGVVR